METVKEFDARHGGDSAQWNNYFIYPNGAMIENCAFGIENGARKEPPTEPYLLTLNILRYWQAKEIAAIEKHKKLYKEATNHVSADLPAPPATLQKLKILKKHIEGIRKEKEAAEAAHNKANPRYEDPQRVIDRVAKKDSAMNELKKLRV